ncbi:DUF3301 domain-containing protein [Dyella caseinilytica]|uniref:DUF3301 domain-containing protein n=1 Tax=Dyella caseinilytica TaxID=1849581 RepID=A0ABX7GVH4_9GAMM|nr:DUF3301 domain-containing protein [Dyella caseinilytica]QRN54422.1 DUF3301 domain-containing protein [Dyella caseinilytica]GFZ94121.1 hypothetical protein GCM10011408_12420 [Dyella caseinilytica]
MGDLATLLLLIILLGLGGTWLTLSRARDRAIQEARTRCQQYGLQLLDETVGLSGVRWRRIGERRVVERRYSFEVSIDGNDREAGHLWMIGNTLTALVLPTIELYTPELPDHSDGRANVAQSGNVVPFRRRNGDRDVRH